MSIRKTMTYMLLLLLSGSTMAWMLDDTVKTPDLPAELIQVPDMFDPTTPQSMPKAMPKAHTDSFEALLNVPLLPEEKPHQLQKKVSILSPMEQANQKYNLAIDKINQKQEGLGEKLLREAVAEYPAHILARIQLAKLAMVHQDYNQAERWLIESPEYFSSHPDYLRTLALVYDRNGKAEDALKIIEKIPADYRKDADFYALAASLYQQTGRYKISKQYYHALIKHDPNNIKWLVGFSIALDGSGEKKQAQQAYQQILTKGSQKLEPQIIHFIESRLEQLSLR